MEKTGMIAVLRKWNVFLCVLISINSFIVLGFNDATLEPHLRSFTNLKPSVVGSLFVIPGLIYAVCNQGWGFLVDRSPSAGLYCCAMGALMSLVAFAFLGPLPIPGTEPSLWMIIVGQVFLGAGMGGMLVCSFVQGLRETM